MVRGGAGQQRPQLYGDERLDGEQASSGESDLEQFLRDSLQSEESKED
jgi:hypothetical protein